MLAIKENQNLRRKRKLNNKTPEEKIAEAKREINTNLFFIFMCMMLMLICNLFFSPNTIGAEPVEFNKHYTYALEFAVLVYIFIGAVIYILYFYPKKLQKKREKKQV